jgi:hypothetical protein
MGNTSNDNRRSVTLRKNTAGQVVAFQAVSTADGSAVTTGTPVVYYTIDGGTQGTGAGTSTHEGNGCWSYAPAQAETNGNHVVFTFALSGAVSQSVNLYPVSFDPTDSVRIGLTALPNAAAGAAGGLPTDSTGKTSFNDLDAAGVRTAVGMASANLDTQLGDLPTVAEFEARTILAAAYFDPAVDAVANVTTVGSVSGSVTVGTNNDKDGYSLATTPPTAAAIADAVWDEGTAGHTTADTYGGRIVRSVNSNVGVQITGSNHIAADVHEFQTDVLTSDATAASFVTEVQSGLATAENQTTILNRLGSWTGSGLNTILGAFRALAGKAASLTPSDISSGTTYDNTTDSLEAIRDRGDAAWAPGEAGSGDASQSTLLAVQDQVEAIAGTLGGTAISVTSRIADGGAMVIYTGDDLKVRSGTQVTVSISDPAGGIYSRLSALGTSQLSWGAARQSQAAGAISGTISSLTQSGSGDAQVVNLVIEILDAGQSLNPADDYIWQVASTSSSGDEYTEIEGTLDLRRRVAVPVTA